jgi:hypothetical protein
MALVAFRSYRDLIDAELDKTMLDAEGIPATILDENLVAVQWLYSNAIGGVKLAVDEMHLEVARAALDQENSADLLRVPESQSPPADGDNCPSCRSSEIYRSRLFRSAAAISLGIGFPLIAWRRRWFCAGCGHSWKPIRTPVFEIPQETLDAERSVQERDSYPTIRGFVLALLGLGILYYVQLQIRNP